MAVIPSERVQSWVCLFLYGWSYPSVRLQNSVFDLGHFALLKQGCAKSGGFGPGMFMTLDDARKERYKLSFCVAFCRKILQHLSEVVFRSFGGIPSPAIPFFGGCRAPMTVDPHTSTKVSSYKLEAYCDTN